jgi:flavin-dependent dehydrogenase
LPIFQPNQVRAHGRILTIGDAAGLVDPVTAEGTFNALRSAQLAAKAIFSSQQMPEKAAEVYQSSLNVEVLNELEAANQLSRYLFGPYASLRNVAFRLFGQKLTDAMVEIFVGERQYAQTLAKREKYLAMLPLPLRAGFRRML